MSLEENEERLGFKADEKEVGWVIGMLTRAFGLYDGT